MSTQSFKSVFKVFLFIGLAFSLTGAGCKNQGGEEAPDESQFSDLFSPPQQQGALQFSELDEASGLANSRSNPDLLWSHNDSGGDPALYLFDLSGEQKSKLVLADAQNRDWEDMAIGAGPRSGVHYLYAADIGDNNAVHDFLRIYRFTEPDLTGEIASEIILGSDEYDEINFVYEDGARDAESLFIEPQSKDIYIITKREANVILYRLAYPQSTSEMNTAQRVLTLPLTFVTASDISPSGKEILIKTYQTVHYWKREAGESIAEALSRESILLNYTREPQGEAIAWSSDETKYFTLSEARNSGTVPIYVYNRN